MRATQQRLLQRVLQQLLSQTQQVQSGVVSATSHGVSSCSSMPTSGIHALSLRFFSNLGHTRAPQALEQHVSMIMRPYMRKQVRLSKVTSSTALIDGGDPCAHVSYPPNAHRQKGDQCYDGHLQAMVDLHAKACCSCACHVFCAPPPC